MKNPEFTIVTDSLSPEMAKKGFRTTDAMTKSTFGIKDAEKMGFSCDSASLKKLFDSDPTYKEAVEIWAKDAGFNLGDANIDALGQFFLYFNEQEINRLYTGRSAVQTFGVKTVGDWLTEKIVFKLRELSGGTSLYDDWSRAPLASYNYGWDTRDTLRLEWGLEVTKLEEAVAGVMRRNAYKDKKDAIVLTQDIWTNAFFYYGSSISDKKLYGVLNEVNAPTATNLPINPADPTLTVDSMISALRVVKQNLATSLKGNGDINSLPIVLACPISWQTAFTVPNAYNGYTAMSWLNDNWKNVELRFNAELETASSGDPCMIVFAKNVPGVGMDSINLFQTSKLRLVGAIPTLKGREESYSASVAGALIACPFAVAKYVAAE